MKPSCLSKPTNLQLINPLNVSTIYDINRIAIKRLYNQQGWRQLISNGVTMYDNDGWVYMQAMWDLGIVPQKKRDLSVASQLAAA